MSARIGLSPGSLIEWAGTTWTVDSVTPSTTVLIDGTLHSEVNTAELLWNWQAEQIDEKRTGPASGCSRKLHSCGLMGG